MTTLATSPVADPDQLALIADDWTSLGKSAAERFRDACLAVARENFGDVDPNKVRDLLLVNGELGIHPRQYSALWSTACARGGYLEKVRVVGADGEETDRLVPIVGPGSRGNGNKSVPMRRWVGDLS